MITFPRVPFIGRRKRTANAQALTLVGASYVVATSVTLSFNRAIDISAIDVAQFFVNDGSSSHHQLQGTGSATLIDASTVRIALIDIGRATGHGVILSALIDNGIVASVGGSAWSGVDGLALPFP